MKKNNFFSLAINIVAIACLLVFLVWQDELNKPGKTILVSVVLLAMILLLAKNFKSVFRK